METLEEQLNKFLDQQLNAAMPIYVDITKYLQDNHVAPVPGIVALLLAAIGASKHKFNSSKNPLEEFLAIVVSLYECYQVVPGGPDKVGVPKIKIDDSGHRGLDMAMNMPERVYISDIQNPEGNKKN